MVNDSLILCCKMLYIQVLKLIIIHVFEYRFNAIPFALLFIECHSMR